MPTVSIIIPVYNAEKYLRQCLYSVLNQTFNDFEVLLINDGSTDTSGEICDEYAGIDTRIEVFHKENGGASSARNVGLVESKGKFICFVDSDDWVNENYLMDMLVLFVNPQVDLVFQGFIAINNLQEKKIAFGDDLVRADDSKFLFEDKEIFKYGYICSKLFRKDIIRKHQIFFPENYNFAEDLSFLLTYLSKCRNVKFEEKYNYHYISQINSLSKTVKKPEEYFNRYVDYKKIVKQHFPEVFVEVYGKNIHFKEFTRSIGGSVFYYVQSLYLNKEFQKEERIRNLKILKGDDLYLMKNFRKHLNHPMYKFAFTLIMRNQFYLADIVLKFFIR